MCRTKIFLVKAFLSKKLQCCFILFAAAQKRINWLFIWASIEFQNSSVTIGWGNRHLLWNNMNWLNGLHLCYFMFLVHPHTYIYNIYIYSKYNTCIWICICIYRFVVLSSLSETVVIIFVVVWLSSTSDWPVLDMNVRGLVRHFDWHLITKYQRLLQFCVRLRRKRSLKYLGTWIVSNFRKWFKKLLSDYWQSCFFLFSTILKLNQFQFRTEFWTLNY